jgi:hypothetical protein
MRLALTVGAAFAAMTLAASANTDHTRVFVRHHGGADLNMDANDDGWISRDEAAAAADRVFDQMDSNNDGRLTGDDRAALHDFDIRIDAPDVEVLEGEDGERRVRVIRRDLDEEVEREVERAVREAERAVEQAERRAEEAERMAERAGRDAEHAARDAERHLERHVVVIRGDGGEWTSADGGVAPVPPVPPVPPAPPLFMMLIANSDEADLNGDGALSGEEFRNQHLRFFDASDANGDGRVRVDPPTPPTPPAPPAPPEPPRRR